MVNKISRVNQLSQSFSEISRREPKLKTAKIMSKQKKFKTATNGSKQQRIVLQETKT